jgi:plasmid stability protein
MANLQVRSIEDQLYKALARRASMENRSISQEVIAILKAYLSIPSSKYEQATDHFLELCGTWEDERSEEMIVKEIRNDRSINDRFGELF